MKQLKQVNQTDLAEWLAQRGPARAFAALANLCADAVVFVVDRERNIVFWSEAGERLLGFGASDVVGQHCLKANRCQTCMVGCGMAEHGSLTEVPLTYYDAEGRPVQLLKSAQALVDAQGNFAGGIELLRPPRADEVADSQPPPPASDITYFHGLVSRDPGMLRAFQTVRNVAETDATALVRGESGSGKEWVARALHAESHRREARFVAVNCAALTPTLIESELFGHVKGAFTGAVRDRDGLFVQADGGTLFLDEVAELPLEVQAKLLRVLESGEVTPVGGSRARTVDVRIVAATHKSLREETSQGRFREDLLYRLRVVPIFLPPLRDRRGDIEVLLWHFIEQFNARGPRRITRVAPEAMRALLFHDWPGNVRELRNVVEFAFAVGRAPELTLQDLPPEIALGRPGAAHPEPPIAASDAQSEERAQLARALAEAGGHVGRAAESLGMSRATFWRKRKRLGL